MMLSIIHPNTFSLAFLSDGKIKYTTMLIYTYNSTNIYVTFPLGIIQLVLGLNG